MIAGLDSPTAIRTLESVRARLVDSGIDGAVDVSFVNTLSDGNTGVVIVFCNPRSVRDATLNDRVMEAVDAGKIVIPVVSSLLRYETRVPRSAIKLNGFRARYKADVARLASFLLGEIGISPAARRLFISHRRSDAMDVAEQLFGYFSKAGFQPFIDRFDIPPGRDMQEEISAAIEDAGMVLFLESPDAHQSPWAFYEVNHAMSHQLGVHIVTWPGHPVQLKSTSHLSRQRLAASDFDSPQALTPQALEAIRVEVESAYFASQIRKRSAMFDSLVAVARDNGADAVAMPRWRIRIEKPGIRSLIVQVISRLPVAEDVWDIDTFRDKNYPGSAAVVVHAARSYSQLRKEFLAWTVRGRGVRLTPENELDRLRL